MKASFVFFFLFAFAANASCIDDLFKIISHVENLNTRLVQLWNQYHANNLPPTLGMEFEYSSTIPYIEVAERISILLDQEGIRNSLIIPSNDRAVHAAQVQYQLDRQTQIIHIKKDSTIAITESHPYQVEIASPILETQVQRDFFHRIRRSVSDVFISDQASSGIHVHVGMPETSYAELAFISLIINTIYDELISHFHVHPSRLDYLQRIPNETFNLFRTRDPIHADISFDDAMFIVNDTIGDHYERRYTILNLLSFDELETIEFRLFNSTLNEEQIQAIQNFILHLMTAIRRKDQRLFHYLNSHSDINFTGIAHAIGPDILNHSFREL